MRNEEIRPGSFRDVAQAYLDDANLKQSTRASYKNLLNQYWLVHLANDDVQTITPARIKQIARAIVWPSTKTQKNAASVLRQVFEWTVEEDYLQASPARGYRTKRNKDEPRPKADPYSVKERDELLGWLQANACQTVYTFYLLAFYSGMRTGELLALKWDDYDGVSFMVERSCTRGRIVTTKTDEVRRVLLPDRVCKVISSLHESRFKKGFVFLTESGEPYKKGRHLNEWFIKAHEKTSIQRSRSPNYPWRHTYASIGLTSGVEPAFLAKQLGHSLTMFETTYAKWLDREEDRAKLERML